jgi:hypothetical protein
VVVAFPDKNFRCDDELLVSSTSACFAPECTYDSCGPVIDSGSGWNLEFEWDLKPEFGIASSGLATEKVFRLASWLDLMVDS